jgi:hypothetical protein
LLRTWFLWKRIISWLARSRGFVDPIVLLSRLERFGQPVDVKGPLELLRAGVIFHARGLLNTGAIQHNLDWVWPYWVVRQYDPHDDSFIPRAFSITHINLTNRNWTAIGIPGLDALPIVDPRGLLTPFWDSWSLDAWLVTEGGDRLYPSRSASVEQHLETSDGVAVVTTCEAETMGLTSRAAVATDGDHALCLLDLTAHGPDDGWLVVSLRPYNPEGVSFIHEIRLLEDTGGWRVDKRRTVEFSQRPAHMRFSYYRLGDVKNRLFLPSDGDSIYCRVGMATGAALFKLDPEGLQLQVRIPFRKPDVDESAARPQQWKAALAQAAPIAVPEPLFEYLYQAALRSLVLHSPGEVYPGPFTYKRFWFRDAVFTMHAMLVAGLVDRVENILDSFPGRQSVTGFFHSQEGEWDSNGEVLWIIRRFCELAGKTPKQEWRNAIHRGARWICRKRLPPDTGKPFSGLLPAGYSAEHLGPSDYYYWDDFWGIAGLRGAASCLDMLGEPGLAAHYRREADRFLTCVNESLRGVSERKGHPGIPASPYRRMDPGAVGSLAAGYPLQLFDPDDPRLLATAAFLVENCMVRGGFFQDVIHSGINPYLTLHLAQVLLRAGDNRSLDLFRTVAVLASPTGQWPEAIHPRTLGGCMGDGQHVWASAEWVLMMRNAFLREEGDGLVLGAGLFPSWLAQQRPLSFGPAPTAFGPVAVTVIPDERKVTVKWEAQWRDASPSITVCLPGFPRIRAEADAGSITVTGENLP